MKPEEVREYFDNTYQFAKKTKMSPASLLNWLKWGFVPEFSQIKLEKITNGELKAEIISDWNKPSDEHEHE